MKNLIKELLLTTETRYIIIFILLNIILLGFCGFNINLQNYFVSTLGNSLVINTLISEYIKFYNSKDKNDGYILGIILSTIFVLVWVGIDLNIVKNYFII